MFGMAAMKEMVDILKMTIPSGGVVELMEMMSHVDEDREADREAERDVPEPWCVVVDDDAGGGQ